MGVTIHYRGRLREPGSISALTDEVRDICLANDWHHQVYDLVMDEDIPLSIIRHVAGRDQTGIHLRGIYFRPHEESESVMLTFTPDGRLLPIISVLMGMAYPTLDDMFWAHTKTQFAGAEIHAVICKLLRYLEKRYFTDWEVLDEAQYWESENVENLHHNFARSQQAIDAFQDALDTASPKEIESVEQLAARVEAIFRNLMRHKRGSE